VAVPSSSANLHVREAGKGPVVLLLHGLGGDHTLWNAQFEPLALGHHVVAPDLRGHGRSPTPDGSTFAFDELEQDLEVLMSQRGAESFHVVAASAGGFLALRLVLDRPERVRSLFLLGTAAQCDGHTRAVAAHWAEVFRDQGYEAYAMRLLKDLFYPEWLEAHLDYIDSAIETMRGRDLRAAVQWGLAIRNFDVRARLGRVRAPTFVLHGMDDHVVDPSHARLLRQAIPKAELKLFPFVGHMVPVEKPEETTRLLTDWLDVVERRAPSTP
jgi:pimeloyl-ACP methyl ester carboxylesterase